MNALSLDFPYIQQEESVKIINFSSSTISAVKNIPSVILGIVLFPFYVLLFIPAANFMLWRLYKKLHKDVSEVKRDILKLPYEKAKEGYDILNSLVTLMDSMDKQVNPGKSSFLVKGIYTKFLKISGLFTEMRDSIASVLFVQPDKTPLSQKEQDSFNVLNDIWGDDSDHIYARHTHHHLTQSLKGYGV
jgi:predicted P-loop ATPase/GTPase